MVVLIPLTRVHGAKIHIDAGAIEAVEEMLTAAVAGPNGREVKGSYIYTDRREYMVKETPTQIFDLLGRIVNDLRVNDPADDPSPPSWPEHLPQSIPV